ncbi:MAG: trypsin-like peptidase domain-containing protein [Gaiellaceae bacterium]
MQGAGCLVDDSLIVTCAHVVAIALGYGDGRVPQESPEQRVQVQFPSSASREPCFARVVKEGWHPPAGPGPEKPGDIALLEIEDGYLPPLDAFPAPLGPSLSEWVDIECVIHGFPEHAGSTLARGKIGGPAGPDGQRGLAGPEWAKIEYATSHGERVTGGFSGGPVWDVQLESVAGIAVAQSTASDIRVGYMIPWRTIVHYLPRLLQLPRRRLRHEGDALRTHWDPAARGLPAGVGAATGLSAGWHFSGRAQILHELINMLRSDDSHLALVAVTALPGAGKSAVIARLATMADGDYRRTVPRAVIEEAKAGTLPDKGMLALAVHARGRSCGHVARRIIAAGGLPIEPPRTEPLDEERVHELGVRLGHEIATRHQGQVPFRIVLDALDEARNDEIASVPEPRRLALMLRAIAAAAGPATFRCVVGTRRRAPRRSDPGSGELLTALGLEVRDPHQVINLDDVVETAGTQRYVNRLLLGIGESIRPLSADTSEQRRQQLADGIATAAAGNFLVALLTTLAVRRAPLLDVAYPREIGGAFELYLHHFAERREQVLAVLRALAYTEGEGLAASDVALVHLTRAVAGDGTFPHEWDDNRMKVEIHDCVLSDAGYLVEESTRRVGHRGLLEDTPLYRLFHQAIIDHLRGDDYEYRQQRIAEHLYRAVPGDRRPEWPDADDYTRRWLLRHAIEAGSKSEVLDALLTDPAFFVHSDPARLDPSLIVRARSPESKATAAALSRLASQLRAASSAAGRASLLELSARQFGFTSLANRFETEVARSQSTWSCKWAHWTRDSAHFSFTAHTGGVNALAFGDIGEETVIVTGSRDGTARVWRPDGTPLLAPLTGHTTGVLTVAIGKLGGDKVIVTGGIDRVLRVWNTDGTLRGRPITGHAGSVAAVVIGELCGAEAIVSGSYDGTVRVWHADGTACGSPMAGHARGVSALTIGELSGEQVIVSAGQDGTMRVWHANGTPRGDPLHGHTAWVNGVAIGKLDGEDVFVSGGAATDETVRIWNADGTPRGEPLTGHTSGVSAVAVTNIAGHSVIVSASWDGTLRVWNADGSLRSPPLAGHINYGGGIASLAIGDLGGEPVLISGGLDNTVRVWPADGTRNEDLAGSIGDTRAVTVGDLGGERRIVTSSEDGVVRVWHTNGTLSGEPLVARKSGVNRMMRTVATGELGGEKVIVSSNSWTVHIWSADGARRRAFSAEGRIEALTVGDLAGTQVIVTGNFDGTVGVWNADGTPRGDPFTHHTEGLVSFVRTVAIGQIREEKVIVSGGGDGTVRLWHEAGRPRGDPLTGHLGWVNSVAIGNFGEKRVIVSGGQDGTVRVWNEDQKASGDPLQGHAGAVEAVALGELCGEEVIVSAGLDGSVRVWGTERTSLLVIPLGTPLFAVAIVPPSSVVVTGLSGIAYLDVRRLA